MMGKFLGGVFKGWYGGAFATIFVYSPKGNFLVKGYMREAEAYIKKNFDRYFCRTVMHHKGSSRTVFHFSGVCGLAIDVPKLKREGYNTRYTVRPYGYAENLNAIQLRFKRFPNKWIPEFDYLIDKYVPKGGRRSRFSY